MIDEAKAALAAITSAVNLPVDVMKAIGMPAAAELGELFRDEVKARRLQRLASLAQGVDVAWKAAGIRPATLPDTFAAAYLEAATLEDDPDLAELWVGLLANAGNPETPVDMGVAFVAILRQLTPVEARLLQRLSQLGGGWLIAVGFRKKLPKVERNALKPQFDKNLTQEFKSAFPQLVGDTLAVVQLHLEQLGLLSTTFHNYSESPFALGQVPASMALTPLGRALMRACELPKSSGPTGL